MRQSGGAGTVSGISSMFNLETENIKRQPDESIKRSMHSLTTAVDLGWPNLIFKEEQRTARKTELFVRGLSSPVLE